MPVVHKLDWKLLSVIRTDASQERIGAALLQPTLTQVDIGLVHPVPYFSKKHTDIQLGCLAQGRGLLKIMLALQHWGN